MCSLFSKQHTHAHTRTDTDRCASRLLSPHFTEDTVTGDAINAFNLKGITLLLADQTAFKIFKCILFL